MKRSKTRETEMLRAARKKLGFSQLQLATELDVQVRQYQRLEYGEQPFSSVNIRLGLRICRILQIDPYELVLGDRCSMDLYVPVQSRPPGQKKNYDSWNGHGFSIRLYCYGTIGMTQEWLMHDNITPAETIVKMMFNSMPERLKELFFGK